MSAPPQSPHSHTAYVEDSEDDIEVLVFKNSRSTNNTINTTAINTNNEQNNKPATHTSMKREPSQKPLAPKNTLRRPGPQGKTSDNGSNPANDSALFVLTDCQSLFGGPFGDTSPLRMEEEMPTFPLNTTSSTTTSTNLTTHTAKSKSRTQTPDEFANITSSCSSKVSKSNPTHIELFNTLSPSQSLGRKRKLTKIRNKLKEKSVEELTQIYNSTDDPGFRKLMSGVYYENCMERLDDWERKL
ncbi:hypothetical protein KCU99_g4097, partial [Aureobasidium melanogenum]